MEEIPNPFLLFSCPTVSTWDLQSMENGHTAKVVPDAFQVGSPGLMSRHSFRKWRVRQARFYFPKTIIQTRKERRKHWCLSKILFLSFHTE